MKTWSRFFLASLWGLVLLMPLGAVAQVERVGDAYQLRLSLTPRETYEYDIRTSIGGDTYRVDFGLRMEVLDRVGDRWRIRVSNLENAPRSTDPIMSMDRRGRVTGNQGANLPAFNYPESPIRIGDRWTGTQRIEQPGLPALSVESVYTLRSVTRIGGREVATLEVTLRTRGEGITGSGTGTMQIDAATGMLVESEIRQTLTYSGSQIQTTTRIQLR